MSGEYYLGRSEWAGTRLRLQHELTKANLDGHVLDPVIPPLKPGMTIADVACGTGVWLLDAVEQNPSTSGEGLDITVKEVPPKGWLPSSVSFREFNILEELPNEYVDKYDIINAQFASSFVRDAHIKQVMDTLVKMLKPGGYLQITDSEVLHWSWITADGDTRPPQMIKLYDLCSDIFGGYGQWTWLQNIEQTFQDAGLEGAVSRRPKAKTSTLQANMMNIMLAQLEASEAIAQHPALSARAAEHREQRDRAAKEAKELGVGMDVALVRCCGRKPAQ